MSSAFPQHYYKQEEIRDALKSVWANKLERPGVLDKVQSLVRVKGRYLALPIERYLTLKTWGAANDEWITAAQYLAKQALCRALSQAGIHPNDLGAIFFTSVTGISSPSIEARLINQMPLSRNIKRIPIFGLGCVAGAAGLSRASDYVRAYPNQAAALISVELCSLTWQRDDFSMANLISAGLFGDGAAASIVTGRDLLQLGPEIVDTRSIFYPHTENVMGWNISEKGFKIVLSRDVPDMVRLHLANDIDEFLASNGLTRDDIGAWVMHTGGPKILEATEEALELPEGALDASWDCLEKVGNLSSASVLLVLQDFMTRRRPEPGTHGLLAAMGPGFCSELVLLKW